MGKKLKGYFRILFFMLAMTGLTSVIALALQVTKSPERSYAWVSPLISLVAVGICLALLLPTYRKIKEIATFGDED